MAELRTRFGDNVDIDLVEGDRGIFDVSVAGELVFSKHQVERFPTPGEVADILAAKIDA